MSNISRDSDIKFLNLLEQTFTSTLPYNRPFKFRCSDLPLCGRKGVFDIIQFTLAEDSYQMGYYTTIGSAIHANIQQWLGRNQAIFGDWICPRCRTIIRNKVGVQTCQKCNLEMQYHEKSFYWKGLSGHTDGYIPASLCDSRWKNGYYILEVKSISDKLASSLTKPKWPHPYQANMYGILSIKQHQLKIRGTKILYISRNNPKNFCFFTQEGIVMEDLDVELETLNQIYNVVWTGQNFTSLPLMCSTTHDFYSTFCRYRKICQYKAAKDIHKLFLEKWEVYNDEIKQAISE